MSSLAQVLQQVGEFGPFQRRLAVVLSLPSVFIAFDVIGQVFVGLGFPHRCNTDWILALDPNLTRQEQLNLTVPLGPDGEFQSCQMFTPVDLDLETIRAHGLNSTTACVDGWRYQSPAGASSIVTEFDAVCDRAGLVEASQSIYMVGFLFGVLLCGSLADRFGRRKVILLASVLFLFSTVSSAFSPNISAYMVLKCSSGFAAGGLGINSFVTAGEWSGSSRFALCSLIYLTSFPAALILLSAVAYLVQDWRNLQLVLFCPVLLLLPLLYWFVPESCRWLLTQGRKEDLRREISRAARINGTRLPEDLLDKLDLVTPSRRGRWLDLFQLSSMRRQTFILSFIWFGCSMVYYGLSLNIQSFGLNVYLVQLVFGVVELLADLLVLALVGRFGRRRCEVALLLSAGSACLLTLAVPADSPVLRSSIAVLGKFFAAASFSLVYTYSAELFPTVIRQSGLGVNSACARLGGIAAPLVRLLQALHRSAPMVLYGAVPIAGACACLLLPETLNMELKDHAEERSPPHSPQEERNMERSTKL